MALTAEPFDPNAYGPGQDARAYWVALHSDSPYSLGPAGSVGVGGSASSVTVGQESAYLYSPAFLQVIAPLKSLPWTEFLVVWTALLIVVLRLLVGRLLFAPILLLCFPELWGGNITILLAAAIVLGFRWAGTWAFVLLTKVTPGLGLVWFAVRREWRALAWVGVATAVIVGVSAAIAPSLWREWFDVLAGSTGSTTVGASVPIPLIVRLPVGLVVVIYAALTDRRWLVPVAALLALPVVWWGSFAMLVGCVALRREPIEAWLRRRLTAPATPA